ncbi:MAG: hypothetical protein IPL59_00265 [Candidatus Competibacteraceae bacterium]|uniref:Lipoprotein n=1 Tax=Candidatus Contendobacter odensis Run_B_J11 TaxID=1400861 RepID=A0A7U7G7K0_9GAMM|nr:hypothetical protein [Candidatus Contendobacter odensis]MBK8533665.1 hypothetical protein [Candidatus Competibacteraceae bacterium]MBK8753972.1 hypothetical protein [Candidatus Competibacteraceae bacterium]CDH43301.1 hypothetical protein BN874_1150004 [Candidatus Contendobacter odensis Run_B_J11]
MAERPQSDIMQTHYHHHRARARVSTIAGLLIALLAGCAPPPPPPIVQVTEPPGKLSEKARQEQQQAILKIRDQTLRQLYRLKPPTRAEIEQAAGYGVFEINGLNAVLGETHGRGVIVTRSGGTTYMQLARTDLGPGVRIKPYRQVLVFSDAKKLSQFVAFGSPTDASRDPSIKVYQLNEKGVSVQADWGARYFRNPDLNSAKAIGAIPPPAR